MTARIHPTALVDTAAELADDVEIGPYCLIGPQVRIGPGCRLVSHVQVAGDTTIGAGCVIHAFASLGGAPQSRSYRGEPTRLEVGSDCDIREGVTMSRGTVQGGGSTKVGDRAFFMAYSHIGHDCHVGDDVTAANGAVLGGHCTVGNNVFLGGLSAVHQHVRIGEGAMLGGASGLTLNLIPYSTALGTPADLIGLNLVGLKRRSTPRQSIDALRRAYKRLFSYEGTLAERVERVAQEYGSDPLVAAVIDFIRSDTRRALCQPSKEMRADVTGDG